MMENKKKEARYLQDKMTLDSQQGNDGLFTIQDLQILNILPENYTIWKKQYQRHKCIEDVKICVNRWVEHWNNGRVQCLMEIEETCDKYPTYTKADLKQFVIDKLKIEKEKIIKPEIEKQQPDTNEGIKSEYLNLIREKKWGKASEVLVEYILENNYIYTTKDDIRSEIWIYENGIYKPEGKSYIKEILRELLGSWYSAYTFNNVITKLEPDTYIDQKEFFNTNYKNEIPVQNGILNILTREINPFNPKKIFFNKLPVKYDPSQTCEKIDDFISEILSSSEDKKVFYELGGFSLLKEYKFEKAFMFVGLGRNGKGKALNLYEKVIGSENCYSLPLSALDPQNADVHQLFGKMLNLAGDIGSKDLKETSMFKGLTGRDPVTAKRKFLNAITFENYAKFIFACNELPMVYDMSKGFWDRWVLLEFPYYFADKTEYESTPPEKRKNWKIRDEDILSKITSQEELSGLLNSFLDGLDRLLKNRRFSSTKGSEEIKTTWIRKSNSFIAFCIDNILDDYDKYISKKDLRKKYAKYCKEHQISSKSDFVIKKVLQELHGVIDEREQMFENNYEWVWRGITWKV